MRRVFLIAVLVGLVFGLDLRHPERNPGGWKGKEYGERVRREYSGPRGQNNPTRIKLMQPLTAPNQKVVGPGGYQFDVPAVLCGQGDVRDEKVFARVVVSDGRFTFSYASDPYSGRLDRTFSTNFTYLCAGGMCQNWDDARKRFTSCVRFRVVNGQVITQPVETLDGCVNPRNQGQLPSYFAGPLISELLEYYRTIGKPITTSKINQDTDGVAEYLGGKVENCQGQMRNPPQTKYFSNPYTMHDAALYYYFTCDPATDPTCRAAKKVMEQERSSDIRTCVIERTVGQSVLRSDQRICTPGQKLFPDGYNSTHSVCFSGDRFFDFSSSFWLECNPDGRGYTLKGWGHWEGAPCGSTDIYPPLPQVSITLPLTHIPNWVEIGRLSVNKRTGDDLSSGRCVSEVSPMRVWLRNVNGVVEVKIDNAPACNRFRWSSIGGLVGEQIVGDCSQYERDNCKLVNEWWEDANGRRIQVIKDGKPVQQLTGCVEILRDENAKVWTSERQTAQAPPQNCNWPPKTCKTIGTRTECRQWWRKIREYKCTQTSTSDYRFDALNQKTLGILNTLEWDRERTGKMRYTVIDTESQGFSCVGGDGECYRITRTQPMFVCPINGRQEPTQSSCDANCYQQHQCNTTFGGYECSVTKARYPDQNSCTSACRSPASCNPVYICPLNNRIYSDHQSCMAGCGNCLEQGQCTSRNVCPSGYTLNPSTGRCETNPTCPSGYIFNPSTGRCERDPICPSGGFWNPSIRQCVAYPTGQQCVIRSASCILEQRICDCWDVDGSCWDVVCWDVSFTLPMTCSSNSCSGEGRPPFWSSGWTLRCYVDTSSFYGVYFMFRNRVVKERTLSLPSCTGGTRIVYQDGDYEKVTITADMFWQYFCPSGYFPSGSMCYSTFFSCPAGSWYDWTVGRCVRNPDCPPGGSYDAGARRCVRAPEVYWDCPFGGTYRDQQTCMANCVRAIPNCCVRQGQCTGDGRIYPIETCASQCFRNEPCYVAYDHVCPVDGRAYSSPSACLSACRTPVQCILQNTNVDRYVCNLNLREYGDYNTCQQNCISQNCASYRQGSSGGGISQHELFIGFAGADPECATGEKYCIVRRTVNGRVEFDTVQCNRSGSSWVCPAGGGQVVEDCKCGKDLKMGLGYTAGVIGIIYSALKDRTCGP